MFLCLFREGAGLGMGRVFSFAAVWAGMFVFCCLGRGCFFFAVWAGRGDGGCFFAVWEGGRAVIFFFVVLFGRGRVYSPPSQCGC